MTTKTLTYQATDATGQGVNAVDLSLQAVDSAGGKIVFYGTLHLLAPFVGETDANGFESIYTVPANANCSDPNSKYLFTARGRQGTSGEGYFAQFYIIVPSGGGGTYDISTLVTNPPSGTLGLTASPTVVTETSFGQTSAAGVVSSYSRGDHTHGTPASVDVNYPKPRLYVDCLHPNASDSASLRGSESTPYKTAQQALLELAPTYGGSRSSLLGSGTIPGLWECDLLIGPGPVIYLNDPPWGGWSTSTPPWLSVVNNAGTPFISDQGSAAANLAALRAVAQVHAFTQQVAVPSFVDIIGSGAAGKEADQTGHPGAICWFVGAIDNASGTSVNGFILQYGESTRSGLRSGSGCTCRKILVTNYGSFGGGIYVGQEIPGVAFDGVGVAFSNGWGWRLDNSGMDTMTMDRCVGWGCGQKLATSGSVGSGGNLWMSGQNAPNMVGIKNSHFRQGFGDEIRIEGGTGGQGSVGGASVFDQCRVGTGGITILGHKGISWPLLYTEDGNSMISRKPVMTFTFVPGMENSANTQDWCGSMTVPRGGRLHGTPVTKADATSATWVANVVRIYFVNKVAQYVPLPLVGDSVTPNTGFQVGGVPPAWAGNAQVVTAVSAASAYIEFAATGSGTFSSLGKLDLGMALDRDYYGGASTQVLPHIFDVRCGWDIKIDSSRYLTDKGVPNKFARYNPTYISEARFRSRVTNDPGGNVIDSLNGWYVKT